jgi:hypothetical protein
MTGCFFRVEGGNEKLGNFRRSVWRDQSLQGMATTITQSTEAQEPAPQSGTSPPLVFQCSSCSQIVADSFSWVCSHRQLNSFTTAGTHFLFNQVSDVVATKGVIVSEELETSKQGVDLGR